MIAQLLGGIGLFLLGMLLLTDGLKAAAGEALKRILTRFTGRTTSAFFSGLTITAMVQSSSATTLATIGFVSAGLLTFAQAIGVVIGSSVGTTTTGWIVSLLGLKLSVGKIAMPLVGIGALMRLVLKDRPAALGLALAGFGLIFVGIETLQQGMDGLSAHVQPDSFPTPTLAGRLLLVLIGVALTVIMQSSSAAVATTITAYHAGTLDLAQSLSLVVGASIGTTVTAALASIGASVPAKRTAFVHVLFNSFASALGFVVLPLFIWLVHRFEPAGVTTGAWAIAVFHTAFTVTGALVVLPGVERFSRLIMRLIKDPQPAATGHLDATLAEVPEVALEALRRALTTSAAATTAWARSHSGGPAVTGDLPLAAIRTNLEECYDFLARVPATVTTTQGETNPRLSLVHAMDHLDQLLRELHAVKALPPTDPTGRLDAARGKLHAQLDALDAHWRGEGSSESLALIEHQATELAALRRTGRHALLRETADAALSPAQADRLLETVRWMDTAAYHLWRISHHLHQAKGEKRTAK
ncbi:MAG: Na/Pi symporter [Opitutaceae bacterium]